MEETTELVQRLCVLAGSIMEDASVEAISLLSPDPPRRRRTLRQLRRAGIDIALLLAAAVVVDRRLVSDDQNVT